MDHQRIRKSRSVQFASRAVDYDRPQPVRIEMYEFYHDLALDFVPFDTGTEFRMLDLGCGTGTFIGRILETYPNATCVAVDFSNEMMGIAAENVRRHSDRVDFLQRNLNEGLPEGLGFFQLVNSFSAIHHLTDENKVGIFRQIHSVLETDGWFLLIDAMSIRFDDDESRQGRRRHSIRRTGRFERAGIDIAAADRVGAIVGQTGKDSPENDRKSGFSAQVDWLSEAGFRSVDHVWHFWMAHFVICRKCKPRWRFLSARANWKVAPSARYRQ